MHKLVKMDEKFTFKNILANLNGENATVYGKNMILMPYAKNVRYENGHLFLVLDFFNEDKETELGIKIQLANDLTEVFDNLIYGQEKELE